jgi:hypothetical protein
LGELTHHQIVAILYILHLCILSFLSLLVCRLKMPYNGLQLPEGRAIHHKCWLKVLKFLLPQMYLWNTKPRLWGRCCYGQVWFYGIVLRICSVTSLVNLMSYWFCWILRLLFIFPVQASMIIKMGNAIGNNLATSFER